jgi:hypothetical protein
MTAIEIPSATSFVPRGKAAWFSAFPASKSRCRDTRKHPATGRAKFCVRPSWLKVTPAGRKVRRSFLGRRDQARGDQSRQLASSTLASARPL